MTLLLHGLSTVLFLACGRVYFHGRFRGAAALAAAHAAVASAVAIRTLPPVAAAATLLLLLALPLGFVALHAVDARQGLFLLPTIYSIPIAFVAGALLWGLLTLVLLF